MMRLNWLLCSASPNVDLKDRILCVATANMGDQAVR